MSEASLPTETQMEEYDKRLELAYEGTRESGEPQDGRGRPHRGGDDVIWDVGEGESLRSGGPSRNKNQGKLEGEDKGRGRREDLARLSNVWENWQEETVVQTGQERVDLEAHLLGYALSQEISGEKRGGWSGPLGGQADWFEPSEQGLGYELGEIARESFDDPQGWWENGLHIFPTQEGGAQEGSRATALEKNSGTGIQAMKQREPRIPFKAGEIVAEDAGENSPPRRGAKVLGLHEWAKTAKPSPNGLYLRESPFGKLTSYFYGKTQMKAVSFSP